MKAAPTPEAPALSPAEKLTQAANLIDSLARIRAIFRDGLPFLDRAGERALAEFMVAARDFAGEPDAPDEEEFGRMVRHCLAMAALNVPRGKAQ